MGPPVKRGLIIYSNGSAPLNKMAAMPIYGKKKHLKYLLQNQESFEAELVFFLFFFCFFVFFLRLNLGK